MHGGTLTHPDRHRIQAAAPNCMREGVVRYSPVKSLWFFGMSIGAWLEHLLRHRLPRAGERCYPAGSLPSAQEPP
jgi:hypothetical protein